MRRLALAVLFAAFSLPSQAQDYPRQTVRIVLGFGAGGGADVSARLFAAKMEGLTGQTFIVVNKPGASGNIAATEVVKAQSDGYTLLWSPSSAYSSNHLMYKNTPYDPKRDLRIATTFNRYGFVLLVNKDNPAGSVNELTEQLRKKGGGLYGSAATSFMACSELYKLATGLATQQVNYKTTGDAVRDLIGNQVDYVFADAAFAISQAQAGRVKMLAITLRDRLGSAPHLPTMAESGIADYEMSGWIALAAPRRTPDDIVRRLNDLAQRVLAMPDVRQAILDSSSEPMFLPLGDIEGFQDSQIQKWRKLLAESKFEMQ